MIIINLKLKKYCQIIKNEKHIITFKTKKLGKRLGTTYCLGRKDYSHNFRPHVVKMTNKVLREKSNCMVCPSNKSTTKNSFLNYKTCICIVKTVKNIQVTHFQKS